MLTNWTATDVVPKCSINVDALIINIRWFIGVVRVVSKLSSQKQDLEVLFRDAVSHESFTIVQPDSTRPVPVLGLSG